MDLGNPDQLLAAGCNNRQGSQYCSGHGVVEGNNYIMAKEIC